MKHIAFCMLSLALVSTAYAQTPQRTAQECGVEPLGKYLNMTIEEFDQSKDGWRSIGNAKEDCHLAAADLIAAYRAQLLNRAAQLDWHEAQGRAFGGQNAQALELFKRNLAYHQSLTGDDRFEPNIYQAEATVAFMEQDLSRLRKARDQLAALPMAPGFAEGVAKFKAKYPNNPAPTWPPNLDAVEGLIRCFDQPYAKAWTCRTQ